MWGINKNILNALVVFGFQQSYTAFEAKKLQGIIYFSSKKKYEDLVRIFRHRYPMTVIHPGKLKGKELANELKNFSRDS
jgi:hypothetical protein